MSWTRRITECIDCRQTRVHHGRGLCAACYRRHEWHGTLDNFERLTYARDELLGEWDLLRLEGYTRAQAAERLGITKARLEKAIERDQRRQREGVAA